MSVYEFFSLNHVKSFSEQAGDRFEQRLTQDVQNHSDWLEKEREGKFIQLRLNIMLDASFQADDLFVFMPFWGGQIWYHATILREFQRRLNLVGDYPHAHRHLDNHSYCDYDPAYLEVVGGGYYQVDPQCLLLTVWGASTVYGKYNPPDMKRALNASGHHFGEYQLLTRDS